MDFFYWARQSAERAHILIVNHALLLADIASGGRVLPTYSHLVVDEAHHLEEAATEQLSYRVEWSVTYAIMQRLHIEADLYQGIMQAAFRQDDEVGPASPSPVGTPTTRGQIGLALLGSNRSRLCPKPGDHSPRLRLCSTFGTRRQHAHATRMERNRNSVGRAQV